VGSQRRIGNQKPREGDNSRIRRHAPNGAIVLNFCMQGVIADVIIHAKFFVNRFRGMGVLTTEILLSPYDWLVDLTTV